MIYLALVILVILQVALPKKWAFVPLVVAVFHLGNVELLPNLTPCRTLIVVGLVRGIIGGFWPGGGLKAADKTVIVFCVIALIVSVAPRLDVASPFTQNVGLILNVGGTYLFGRMYLTDNTALQRFGVAVSIIMVPLALLLTVELTSRKNLYWPLGAHHSQAVMRDGKVRAQGPFKHAILAGTAGATTVPLCLLLWRRRRKIAIIGAGAGSLITFCSTSSGPLSSLAIGVAAILLWNVRGHMQNIRRIGTVMLIGMHLMSTRGVWYLMARIDLVGGSTGFHRAKLIDNAFDDFGLWWLHGTDYTRNWMFSGVTWSDRHTDLTNYYIHLGVIGGVWLIICLIALLTFGYKSVGKGMIAADQLNYYAGDPKESERSLEENAEPFMFWCVGATLFSHTITFLSVSYFDQMFVMFYLVIALVVGNTQAAEEELVEEESYIDEEGYAEAPYQEEQRLATYS